MDNQFTTATRSTKQITIYNNNPWYQTDLPVTVQRFSDLSNCCDATFIGESDFCSDCKEHAGRDLVWCNHAGAVEETYDNVVEYPEGPARNLTVRQMVCKCGAYQYEDDAHWYDAPEDGVSE